MLIFKLYWLHIYEEDANKDDIPETKVNCTKA